METGRWSGRKRKWKKRGRKTEWGGKKREEAEIEGEGEEKWDATNIFNLPLVTVCSRKPRKHGSGK